MLDIQIYFVCVCIMHMLVPINTDCMLPKKLKILTDTAETINLFKLIFWLMT